MKILKQLNEEYAISQQLSIEDGEGKKAGFSFIHITNDHADAVISLYGGQILSYQPKDKRELFFESDAAFYQSGKAIKGGIPICWPWFGDDPEGQGRSAHGFVRNRLWSIRKTSVLNSGETELVLGLVDSDDTQAIWPYAFDLSLTFTIGKTLRLALQTHNTGDKAISISQALHSYYAVGDIHKTYITGLEGNCYLDKTSASEECIKQSEKLVINKETDRIYLDTPSEMNIIDTSWERSITLSAQGSFSTVVWNPWGDVSTQMTDLQNNDYLHFVCVETANVETDTVKILADESFCLAIEIAID